MEQKYIVGDVVMYHNKIMVVKEPRDGSHFDLFRPKEGLVYFFVGVEDIKPVVLNPEILEKNGWSREDGVFGVSPDFKKIIDDPARKKGYITCMSVYPFFDKDGFSFFIIIKNWLLFITSMSFNIFLRIENQLRNGGVGMLYALRFFDTERSLWYLDCVHRSKSFLKRREKKFLKRGIKTMISKWYGL